MGITFNTNMVAADAAIHLNNHYSRLATSTQRLSTGMRINSAADDAAGLAIRELMRADIAALRQGTRNVNDAISLIQTFDGALSVIDEKLIRMRELAEQAATGTYDSTQRLMIDSEFQAMGAEINRIARATDFNGLKMLDGVGIPNDDPPALAFTFDAQGLTAELTGSEVAEGITNPTALPGGTMNFKLQNIALQAIPGQANRFLKITGGNPGDVHTVQYQANVDLGVLGRGDLWTIDGGRPINEALGSTSITSGGVTYSIVDANGDPAAAQSFNGQFTVPDPATSFRVANAGPSVNHTITQAADSLEVEFDLGNGNVVKQKFNGDPMDATEINISLKVNYATKPVKIHFGPGNDSAEDYYYINTQDCTLAGLGLDGVSIQTQDSAQEALVTLKDAMVEKDKVRAYFGAMQNRLENTMTNLTVQAENLQAAESRLSDADIAREMTNFVRNQILTNSAVAMLSQGNSMPQMLIQLLR